MIIYLYIKQCKQCGLKYFGKTIQNPFKYRGSGEKWNSHLKKHGNHINTLEVFQFKNQTEATEFALKFSQENDIVESKKWANAVLENALGGWIPGQKHTAESKQKLSKANKGNIPWCAGKKLSEHHKNNIKLGLLNSTKKLGRRVGFKQSEYQKQKMREYRKNKKMSEYQKKILYSEEISEKRVNTRMKNRNGKYNAKICLY